MMGLSVISDGNLSTSIRLYMVDSLACGNIAAVSWIQQVFFSALEGR